MLDFLFIAGALTFSFASLRAWSGLRWAHRLPPLQDRPGINPESAWCWLLGTRRGGLSKRSAIFWRKNTSIWK